MKVLKIALVVIVLLVILYLVYIKLIKKSDTVAIESLPSASLINDSAECKMLAEKYKIVPGVTWGNAADKPEIIEAWKSMTCYQAIGTVYSKPKIASVAQVNLNNSSASN